MSSAADVLGVDRPSNGGFRIFEGRRLPRDDLHRRADAGDAGDQLTVVGNQQNQQIKKTHQSQSQQEHQGTTKK